MYKVFENLDIIINNIQDSPRLFGSKAMLNREDTLALLDELRSALPAELDHAQDVLDQQEAILEGAQAEANRLVDDATAQADAMIAEAQQDADAERERAETDASTLLSNAHDQADHVRRDADHSAQETLARADAEAQRIAQKADTYYERTVEDARLEQQRMLSESEIVRLANEEARSIVEAAHVKSSELRRACDEFVEEKLANFESTLTETLRIVSRDRSVLRQSTSAAGPQYLRSDDTGNSQDNSYRADYSPRRSERDYGDNR
ncbi:DivIVA domain-containing protein [Corynebacterium choanae]|uniref:V-type ATP synthase subunit E n=1 Tax=Corynebacterium choanae TaxID=1862358 RepID=A0A3G6J719_9CORY|nr:DivIVA domain-containing protein [Corynebacterium choanae]AZA13911.1 V-type ATP synthase subunit E [Corynebacterium choanae]